MDYKNEESFLNPNSKEKPLNIQLMSKLSFSDNRIKIDKKKYRITIKNIHELPYNRIGILTEFYLLIHSLNTFKLINKLEPDLKLIISEDKKIDFCPLFDFIVLKNNDLVIWNSKIIFFYSLTTQEYKQYQTINEYNLGENKDKYFDYYYNKYIYVKSIYELSNDKLVSCNSYELKIYYKKNNEYYLESKLITYDVEKVYEIKPNILILFQKNFLGRKCLSGMGRDVFMNSISIYDIKKEKELNLKIYDFLVDGEGDINFLIKNNYLLTRYGNNVDIFNIDKNMELIKNENDYYNFNPYNKKKLKIEMKISFLCDYYGDLFFVKNLNGVKIYKFENEKISFFSDFPFEIKRIKGMIKLKNNLLVMYSEKEIKVLQ